MQEQHIDALAIENGYECLLFRKCFQGKHQWGCCDTEGVAASWLQYALLVACLEGLNSGFCIIFYRSCVYVSSLDIVHTHHFGGFFNRSAFVT